MLVRRKVQGGLEQVFNLFPTFCVYAQRVSS